MTKSRNNPLIHLSPSMRLQWEKAQNTHVLLYPEGMVQLNDSAAAILKLCDGTRTATQIVLELTRQFGDNSLTKDINDFLGIARGHGWIISD